MNIRDNLPYFGMTLLAIFWGASWPAGKIVATDMGTHVLTAAFIRFTFAVPLLFAASHMLEGRVTVPREYHGKLVLFGLMQTTLYNFFYLSGLRYTTSSDASLIIASVPALTMLIASSVYSEERITLKKSAGTVIAFFGVMLIVALSPNSSGSNRLLGDALIFLGATTWAVYTVFSRKTLQEVRPILFQTWATSYGWLALGFLSVFENPMAANYTASALLSLLYLGIFAAAISNTLFNISVKKIGPSRSAIFVNLVPLFAMLTSFLLLGEQPSVIFFCSFLLIVAGVRLVSTS